VPDDSIVFFDAMVLLGADGVNQTQTPLRLVGYEVQGVKYWIAANRYDLSAEQIAQAYKLRWNIENFFRLVEKTSESLSSDRPESLRLDGSNPVRSDHIFAAGLVLSQQLSRESIHQASSSAAHSDRKRTALLANGR